MLKLMYKIRIIRKIALLIKIYKAKGFNQYILINEYTFDRY
jgi:hypothetical protein